MLKDGALVCDGCQTKITRVVDPPAEGWAAMRNLCPSCFTALWKTSIPPA